MKVILNLTEQQVKDLKEISSVHGESYEELLMKTFYDYIYNPATVLGEEKLKDNLNDFDKFSNLLGLYMHENIQDIDISSKHIEEAYTTDKHMVEVYRRLLHNHLYKPYIITDLYKTYKSSTDKHNE